MSGSVRHFYRVLEADLPVHEEAGWLEGGRESIPSLPNDPVCMIEWNGKGEPVLPNAKEGKKDDQDKIAWSQIPRGVLTHVVAVLTDGAKRYGGDNWMRVPNARVRYYDALMRHIDAYWSGELIDPQSNRPHLAHAAANILFLLWFQLNNDGKET